MSTVEARKGINRAIENYNTTRKGFQADSDKKDAKIAQFSNAIAILKNEKASIEADIKKTTAKIAKLNDSLDVLKVE